MSPTDWKQAGQDADRNDIVSANASTIRLWGIPYREAPCAYERARSLPAGRELDEFVQKQVIRYPAYKVAPKWSTDPRRIPTLLDQVREYLVVEIVIVYSPGSPSDKQDASWSVTATFSGFPADHILAAIEPYEQEGEGGTLSLALCRALLHIACDTCPRCTEAA